MWEILPYNIATNSYYHKGCRLQTVNQCGLGRMKQ